MPKLAEYFDSDRFESSASRIWTLDSFSQQTKYSTSLFFVPESDIAHFHFNFELIKSAGSKDATILVTRERSLVQEDLVNKRKNAQLMIQILAIDGEGEQLNLKKFMVNLFEKDRAQYDRFQKQIVVGSVEKFLVNDVLKIRVGGGILKDQAPIPDAEPSSQDDYSPTKWVHTLPQSFDFSTKTWTVPKFSKLKLSELLLPISAPHLGVSTNLHLDLYRHEDTNRLTIGIRRERFFIKDDVVEKYRQMKLNLNFAILDQFSKKFHFQEIAMSFFENERSNYGNHVKEFIIEEDVLKDEQNGLVRDDTIRVLVEAVVMKP